MREIHCPPKQPTPEFRRIVLAQFLFVFPHGQIENPTSPQIHTFVPRVCFVKMSTNQCRVLQNMCKWRWRVSQQKMPKGVAGRVTDLQTMCKMGWRLRWPVFRELHLDCSWIAFLCTSASVHACSWIVLGLFSDCPGSRLCAPLRVFTHAPGLFLDVAGWTGRDFCAPLRMFTHVPGWFLDCSWIVPGLYYEMHEQNANSRPTPLNAACSVIKLRSVTFEIQRASLRQGPSSLQAAGSKKNSTTGRRLKNH